MTCVGDLVFCGSSAANWTAFDTLATPLYDACVPVFPLHMGNHDYGIVRQAALRHFFTLSPIEEMPLVLGDLRAAGAHFLDSNARRLPVAQWRKQIRWYKRELQRALKQEPDIRGVLVRLHHPPYTNSNLWYRTISQSKARLCAALSARS